MPVVEYKLHIVTNKGGMAAPLWVAEGGYHQSPIDNTMVGWALHDSDREYYIPDTVVELSKTDFINRQLSIHSIRPFDKEGGVDSEGIDFVDPEQMDSAEVITTAGKWYDDFISRKS